jgi:putative transposase
MARIARAVAPGYPHHILQRGNSSQPIFEEDADYRRYLGMLGECMARFGLSVWAYCLMSDHVQYVCVPKDFDSLAKALNTLHMRYSQYFNDKKGRHGHLWQGRFYSSILDDRHALEAMRYDETNPVRCGLVKDATAYPWSSARGHALGVFDPVLQDGCSIMRGAGDWKSHLGAGGDVELVENILKNMKTGRPCGDLEFVRRLEILLDRSLTARLRGRPKKITA